MNRLWTVLFVWMMAGTSFAQVTVSGKVVDQHGTPLKGIGVNLQSEYGIDITPAIASLTSADGTYVLENVPHGTFRVRAREVGDWLGTSLVSPNFDFEHRKHEVNFTLPILDPSQLRITAGIRLQSEANPSSETYPGMTGVLLDATTFQPLSGVEIKLFQDSSGGPVSEPVVLRSDNNGQFKWAVDETHLFKVELSKEGYEEVGFLYVRSVPYSKAKIYLQRENEKRDYPERKLFSESQVTDENGKQYRGVLVPGVQTPFARLSGDVLKGREPVVDATVELLGLDSKPLGRFLDGKTNDQGTYFLVDVEPGTYLVRITHRGESITIPNMVLKPGDNRLSVDI